MKHVYLLGQKQYAFCAIDPAPKWRHTKEAAVHIASSPSSRNAKPALEKTVMRFEKGVKFVSGNGSGNMKDAEGCLTSQSITRYWARSKPPKGKPFAGWFIGALQKECLDYNHTPLNAAELSSVIGAWLDKYHFYRPHQSLGFRDA
ncbi:MAG: integrase core domain-containing protein [Treponema sp.]|jgi:transposase InsO family protein|nr:integrase core domain-containing protein [Treponema sp.]